MDDEVFFSCHACLEYEVEAKFYCKQCGQCYCSACKKAHLNMTVSKCHELIAIEEYDPQYDLPPHFCPLHPDMVLDCFCLIKREPICFKCAYGFMHTVVHDCGKETLGGEEVKQRRLFAQELLYIQEVQGSLEDLDRSFHQQLEKDQAFISSCLEALKEIQDADKEFLSTQSTSLEKNVYLDIEKLEVLMWTTRRFVEDFHSVKDLCGYDFVTGIKRLHLDSLLKEIRSQENRLPPVRRLNSLRWPYDLKLKLKALDFQMRFRPNRDYSQIGEQPILQFVPQGNGDGQSTGPGCIAISPDGAVWVVNRMKDCIQVYDQNGSFLFTCGTRGSENGQLDCPEGMVFDPIGSRVFVCDRYNDRIQYFDLKGNFLGLFGTFGNQDGQFEGPAGIAIDESNGDFYVTDFNNHRVQVFDANLKFLRKFGSVGPGNGELEHPRGIDFLSNGQLVVSEWIGNRLSVFEKSGKFVKHLGSGHLEHPLEIFVDGKDNILVADNLRSRIAVFSSEAKEEEDALIKSIENVPYCYGIAMNKEGKLFCSHRGDGHKVSVF